MRVFVRGHVRGYVRVCPYLRALTLLPFPLHLPLTSEDDDVGPRSGDAVPRTRRRSCPAQLQSRPARGILLAPAAAAD
jgi:hypothetical protein